MSTPVKRPRVLLLKDCMCHTTSEALVCPRHGRVGPVRATARHKREVERMHRAAERAESTERILQAIFGRTADGAR